MLKVASIVLLLVAAAIADDDVEEIVLNNLGCPVSSWIYKIIPGDSCNKFFKCSNGVPYEFTCPEGTLWNIELNACDWAREVDCGARTIAVNQEQESGSAANDAASICGRDESDGLLVPHVYCNHLYMCARGVPIDITCPEPLLFNADEKICDWENKVDCGDRLMEKQDQDEPESQEKK